MSATDNCLIAQSKAFDGAYVFIKSYFPQVNDTNRMRMVISAMKKNDNGKPADANTEYTFVEALAKVHGAPLDKYVEENAKGILEASLQDWFKSLEIFLKYFDNNDELKNVIDDVATLNMSEISYDENEIWGKWMSCCLEE